MRKVPARRQSVEKREKTLEEEVRELDDQMLSRPALDFQTYQRAVMECTNPWPIEKPNQALLDIMWHCKSAYGQDKEVLTKQVAAVLKILAQLCDHVPISLERVAHISLSELPTIQGEIAPNSNDINKIE